MRRFARILLPLAAALVALEFVLQGAALVALLFARAPAAALPRHGATVLCIGDSYTYGLGASGTAQSYPAVLETLLRADGKGAPAVVNAGFPGQNSREALLRLEEHLAEHAPRVVCVLVGLNDSWTRPAAVTGEELRAQQPEGRWQWRWRTLRLVSLLLGQAAGGRAHVPAPPAPAPDAQGAAKQGAPREFLEQVVVFAQQGQPAKAVEMLERALATDPANAAEYHQGLVQVHTALGHRREAEASLQWLRREHAERPTQQVAESLVVSLYSFGDRQAAGQLGRTAAARFPERATFWWASGQAHYSAGDLAAAERDLDRALAAAAAGDPKWRAILHRDCARVCCGRDAGKAVRLMVTAMQLDGEVEPCRLIVEGEPGAFTPDAIRAALANLQLGSRDFELVQRLFGSGWSDRAPMLRVLEGHLRLITGQCRARGARVVLLTYPLAVADLEALYLRVGRELEVPVVRCLPRFEQELQRRKHEDLYIRDGHCTDAGYALMAEVAAPAVELALR